MERLQRVTRRGVQVAAAAGLVTAVASATASPVLADPPPAAAGTTSHGFLAVGDVVTAIDHPDATAVPATPDAQAGTLTAGINDRGAILGAYEDQERVVRHFVRDRRGRYTELEDPADGPDGSASDEYIDINNQGEVVGFYNDEQGFTTTGFLRTERGRFVDIDVPRSQVTGPLKMNDRGHVVGLYVDAGAEPDPDGPALPGAVHGFVWRDGDLETVDVRGAAATIVTGINDRGQMVGSYIDAGGAYHGFVRDRRGHVTVLPEAPGAVPTAGGTQPTSINERGQIVGLAYDARGGSRAFRYERGRFALFDGTPGAVFTRPLDVDNRGRAVGDYGTRPADAAATASTTWAEDRGEMVIPQPLAMLDPPRDRS